MHYIDLKFSFIVLFCLYDVFSFHSLHFYGTIQQISLYFSFKSKSGIHQDEEPFNF